MVHWDKNNNGIVDASDVGLANGDLSRWHIYGGAQDTALTANTKILMNSGNVKNIYGGGQSNLSGTTNVTIKGGTVEAVYGGAMKGTVS